MPSVEVPRSGGAAAPGRSAAQRWGRAARLGRDVGEEVSRCGPEAAGRGRHRTPRSRAPTARGSGGSAGDPQWSDQTHAAATARTSEHVKLKGAPHQVSPRPVAGFARTRTLKFTDAVRAGLGRGGVS